MCRNRCQRVVRGEGRPVPDRGDIMLYNNCITVSGTQIRKVAVCAGTGASVL